MALEIHLQHLVYITWNSHIRSVLAGSTSIHAMRRGWNGLNAAVSCAVSKFLWHNQMMEGKSDLVAIHIARRRYGDSGNEGLLLRNPKFPPNIVLTCRPAQSLIESPQDWGRVPVHNMFLEHAERTKLGGCINADNLRRFMRRRNSPLKIELA